MDVLIGWRKAFVSFSISIFF